MYSNIKKSGEKRNLQRRLGRSHWERKNKPKQKQRQESMVSWKPGDEIIARRREGSTMTHTTDRSGKMTISNLE